MASIVSVKRKKGIIYYISYRVQGKQIKYRCNSDEDAKRRLPDIQVAEREQREYVSYESTSNNSNATTVSELIAAYLAHHTKELSASTVSNYHGISEHYIIPYIGKLNLNRVSTAVLQRYYDDLPNHPAVQGNHKTPAGNISARTVREVHKILRPAFRLAVKLGWMVANPATELELPSTETFVRTQWSEAEVMSFIASCKEDDVALAVAIMFFGTMRSGELCGLTWDCVNVIGEPAQNGLCSIKVSKTLTRLQCNAVSKSKNDIIFKFPSQKASAATVLVLKKPKTSTSVRTVYLPSAITPLLKKQQAQQEYYKTLLGEMYSDYNLVICNPDGTPCSVNHLSKRFKRVLTEINAVPVDMYSLRHSGATAKLRATGDIKAVQGDMGHSSADMLLNVYASIRDDDRKSMASTMSKWLQDTTTNMDVEDNTDRMNI